MDEADLIRRLQSGDEGAWTQFMAEWGPRLHKHIRRRMFDHGDAEDVLSETIVAIVQAIHRGSDNGSFSAWLYGIADKKVAEYASRQTIANIF
jgi:DNA-directed RNA polymerase specialized sigma24 family protein